MQKNVNLTKEMSRNGTHQIFSLFSKQKPKYDKLILKNEKTTFKAKTVIQKNV